MKKNGNQCVLCALSLLGIILSGCASRVVPAAQTQVAANEVTAVNAMLTMTHAVEPHRTSTPVPTPLPFMEGAGPSAAASTSGVPVTGATPGSGQSAVDCNHPLDVAAAGPRATVLIKNHTNVPITFTMGLAGKSSFGQCGVLSWARIPGESSITVMVSQVRPGHGDSCYWAWALLQYPNRRATVSDGGFCISNGKKWVFNVNSDRIRLVGP